MNIYKDNNKEKDKIKAQEKIIEKLTNLALSISSKNYRKEVKSSEN